MIRKIGMLLAVLALLALTAGCGGTKIVHCDHCGGGIELAAGDKIEEDWIVFCKTCEEALFGDEPVVSPGN